MGLEVVLREAIKNQYSPEEKTEFSNIIKRFVKLYYDMSKQTWGVTKWRGVYVTKAVTDLWVYQELIYEIKPDLIIETGTLFGGSAYYMHNICRLMELPTRIITIDVDAVSIHKEVRDLIDRNVGLSFFHGSSIGDEAIAYVKAHIASYKPKRVMVVLDSLHTVDHVKKELELYATFVTVGSALIIEDTYPCIELVPMISDWMLDNPSFKRNYVCEKFMLTFNRDGYLEKVDPTKLYDNGVL